MFPKSSCIDAEAAPSGFDEDHDGEWWPPPLTEQDVAIRHRAKRLLQAFAVCCARKSCHMLHMLPRVGPMSMPVKSNEATLDHGQKPSNVIEFAEHS